MRKRTKVVLAALVAIAAMLPIMAVAADRFTDVPDTNVFHDDIGWLADAGITLGCNPPTNDEFCPKNNVTREQMSAFMRRFAQYLGAEDGTVSTADSAAFADNAGMVDGKNASDFQPAVVAFDHNAIVDVDANATFELAAAEIDTADGLFCLIGSSPVSTILVRASGYTEELDDGESASLRLELNGTANFNTTRRLEDSGGAFAMEWLYEGEGGTESFALIANEIGGDIYEVEDAQITLELIQDTTCRGAGGIVLPSPDTSGEPGEE